MKRTNPNDMKYLRLLLYGDPGSTKTRTAASAALDPRTAPVLQLDISGNPVSIRDYQPQPDILTIEQLTDLNPVYNFLAKGQRESDPIVKEFNLRPPYKTIIIDGMTDTQRVSLGMVSGNDLNGPGDLPLETDYRVFGKVLGQMVKISKLFYALPMHVIMTSLEHSDKDERTGSINYKPLLWGQSSTEVAGYAFIVARLVHRTRVSEKVGVSDDTIDKNANSIALFKPSGKYVAKWQYGKGPTWMPDPTIGKIMDLAFPDTKVIQGNGNRPS